MFKKGDKVRVVRISPGSPTVPDMIGSLMKVYLVKGEDVYIKQQDGRDKGLSWVCIAGDLERAEPISPLECLIKAYVDEQRKELGL